jgi:phage terminase Nu1 subunit (DNA packaging protein)
MTPGAKPEPVRNRLIAEQVKKLERENRVRGGELVERDVTLREWQNVLRYVRDGMLAVPSRVQQKLGHLSPADVAAIDREIRDVLAELGNDNAPL